MTNKEPNVNPENPAENPSLNGPEPGDTGLHPPQKKVSTNEEIAKWTRRGVYAQASLGVFTLIVLGFNVWLVRESNKTSKRAIDISHSISHFDSVRTIQRDRPIISYDSTTKYIHKTFNGIGITSNGLGLYTIFFSNKGAGPAYNVTGKHFFHYINMKLMESYTDTVNAVLWSELLEPRKKIYANALKPLKKGWDSKDIVMFSRFEISYSDFNGNRFTHTKTLTHLGDSTTSWPNTREEQNNASESLDRFINKYKTHPESLRGFMNVINHLLPDFLKIPSSDSVNLSQ